MSLILEALRKLDRDKQTPERSLVVTGASDWARAEPRAGRALAWGVGLLASAGALFFLWQGRTAHAPSAPPNPPAAASPGTASAGDSPADATAGAPSTPLRREMPRSSAASAALPDAPRARPTPPQASAPPATTAVADAGEPAPPATTVADAGELETADAAPDAVPPRATEPAPARAEIELQAITQRDGRPIAIVNGRLVREGDSFDGIRVLRIGAAEIEVEVKGQRRTIGF